MILFIKYIYVGLYLSELYKYVSSLKRITKNNIARLFTTQFLIMHLRLSQI